MSRCSSGMNRITRFLACLVILPCAICSQLPTDPTSGESASPPATALGVRGQEEPRQAKVDGTLVFPEDADVRPEELARIVVWLNWKHPSGGWHLEEAGVSDQGRFVFDSVFPGARFHFGVRHTRFVLIGTR